jgi:hypothetical protein
MPIMVVTLQLLCFRSMSVKFNPETVIISLNVLTF